MFSRHEGELLLQALTGGANPEAGNSIVFGLYGWYFGLPFSNAGWVSIDADGAAGDGVTNDAGMLQSVLDRAKFILVPPKTFLTNDTLKFHEGQVIVGTGSTTSVIKGGNLTKAVFQSDNVGASRKSVMFMNLKIDNQNKANVGGIGIRGTLVDDLILINVASHRVETGFLIDGNSQLINTIGYDCDIHYDCDSGFIRCFGPRADGGSTGFDIGAGVAGIAIIDPEFIGLTDNYTGTLSSLWLMLSDRLLAPKGASTDPSISFSAEDTLGFYWHAAAKMGLKGHFYLDGDLEQITGKKVGLYGATPVVQQTSPAIPGDYTGIDVGGGGFVGIDNAQAGNVYAKVADLNSIGATGLAAVADLNDLKAKVAELVTIIENIGIST